MPYSNNNYYGQYTAQADVTYDVYGLVNGAWSLLGSSYSSLYGESTRAGIMDLYGTDNITIQTSSQVTVFRIANIQGGDMTGGSVAWTSTSYSGDRSATPNGEKITATMRPN